jgi:hypothetical protein
MTIADKIQHLARSTNASAAFVEHVERVLALKGIALQSDAMPFEALLDETFHREAAIHANARAALDSVMAWRASIEQLQAAAHQQLDRLTVIQATLDGSLRKLHASAQSLRLAKPLARGDVRN